MAFKAGRLAQITVNTKPLDTFCDSADLSFKVDMADTSTFTAQWKTFIPGLIGADVSLSGDYDPTVTTGPASVFTGLLGAAAFPVVFYPAGNNSGQGTSHTFNALVTDYKESSKVSDKVTFAATLRVTGADTIAQL